MNKILMPMRDGGIVGYEDNARVDDYGCPTCGYGSEYINEISIALTKYKIHVVLNQMYEHALSESDMMQLLLPAYDEVRALDENGFAPWFKEKLICAMQEKDRYVEVETVLREYDVQKVRNTDAELV